MLSSSVVVMCGLPASGKTTAAGRIHAEAGGVLIRSCDVYHSLGISLPDWVRRTKGFTQNVTDYERERDRAYVELRRQLKRALASAAGLIVLDAVHGESDKRQAVYRLCQEAGRLPVLVWCRCADVAEIRRRFRRRRGRAREPEHEAADLSVFRHIAGLWEEPMEDRLPDGRRVPFLTYDTVTRTLELTRAVPAAVEEIVRAALLNGLKGHRSGRKRAARRRRSSKESENE